ncbi:GGDEF domain-containing protein [Colwellia sp. D2M02]|uniref:GGDEF domain-containing protein n=1 Tax=Colwellia sp. D2M02 TaxID=2841562 RepID=UPI001C096B46|nr:GGDEF domain-containing protein [Colwellia sp. D2M02]MBU2893966.1 GGDEF domain-containing protein [Colwellia sp. D2M02]
MNDNSVGQAQLDTLQKKLDSAIDSRRTLEEDFKTQSTLLIQFISKLSLVSKGVDLELDNRLAKLRALFTKSAPIADIENSIAIITKLLQQHAITNEKNIAQMHQRFNFAGESLQKVNGLPSDLRRNLRELLSETKSTKDALIQYVPLLSQLLEFYINALSAKEKAATNGLLTTPNNAGDSAQTTLETSSENNSNTASTFELDGSLLEKISVTLSALNLSQAHTNQLLAIKKKLMADTTNKEIVNHFLEIFDVIVAEFKNEQNNAKSFLTSLSDTLTSVQLAVKETLETQKSSQLANDKINVVLQKQLVDMTGTVEKALSLDQVKLDINDKLQKIAGTLEAKSKIEQQSQLALSQKLTKMAEKVAQLEEKSRVFEEKLAEQQIKSMQDALTKLANRAAFDDYFAKAMVRFQHRPFELALVVIDIDDFKKINDTYGHSAGDKTLQVIANTIQKHVSKDVFVGRYGGEEFVLIYSQTAETDLINELNTINKQVARLPFKFKNNKVSITLSIGATHIRTDDNIHLAFERADEAMYKAKSQGKNQVIYSK